MTLPRPVPQMAKSAVLAILRPKVGDMDMSSNRCLTRMVVAIIIVRVRVRVKVGTRGDLVCKTILNAT